MLLKFLTQSYPTEKNIFLIPRLALRIIGFYPEESSSRRRQAFLIFNWVILVYGCYAEFMFGIQNLSIDVVRALDALCPVASSIMSVVKVTFLWYHRAELNRLIKRVTELNAAQDSPLKSAYKHRYFATATRLSASLLFFGFITATLYGTRAGMINYLSYLRKDEIPFETPFKMIFPQSLLSMPLFPLTFILSLWHGYITIAGFAGTDGLFLCFCMYIGTLLKALQYDMKDLLWDVHSGVCKSSAEYEIKESLKMIIARHNEIIDLVKRFSAVMSGVILGHFVTSSAIIGTGVLDMLLFSDYGVFVYLLHTMTVTTELYLYCIGGTVVIECSSQLATAAYDSHWYTHSVEVQKMVLLIILRAQRSLVIKVPFFAPSLSVLTSILRFTGSLIALAKSVI